jgi:hypothetical protein
MQLLEKHEPWRSGLKRSAPSWARWLAKTMLISMSGPCGAQ